MLSTKARRDKICRMARSITPIEVRFWRYVKKLPDGCWLWTGAKANGYGVIREAGQFGTLIKAHRLSYQMHVGPLAETDLLCHHCDIPFCVNPDHLFPGTQVDNMRDAAAKGHLKTSGAHSSPGSAHHQAKLDETDVLIIRAVYAEGGSSLNRLAARYSVSQRAIWQIIHRVTWRHV